MSQLQITSILILFSHFCLRETEFIKILNLPYKAKESYDIYRKQANAIINSPDLGIAKGGWERVSSRCGNTFEVTLSLNGGKWDMYFVSNILRKET